MHAPAQAAQTPIHTGPRCGRCWPELDALAVAQASGSGADLVPGAVLDLEPGASAALVELERAVVDRPLLCPLATSCTSWPADPGWSAAHQSAPLGVPSFRGSGVRERFDHEFRTRHRRARALPVQQPDVRPGLNSLRRYGARSQREESAARADGTCPRRGGTQARLDPARGTAFHRSARHNRAIIAGVCFVGVVVLMTGAVADHPIGIAGFVIMPPRPRWPSPLSAAGNTAPDRGRSTPATASRSSGRPVGQSRVARGARPSFMERVEELAPPSRRRRVLSAARPGLRGRDRRQVEWSREARTSSRPAIYRDPTADATGDPGHPCCLTSRPALTTRTPRRPPTRRARQGPPAGQAALLRVVDHAAVPGLDRDRRPALPAPVGTTRPGPPGRPAAAERTTPPARESRRISASARTRTGRPRRRWACVATAPTPGTSRSSAATPATIRAVAGRSPVCGPRVRRGGRRGRCGSRVASAGRATGRRGRSRCRASSAQAASRRPGRRRRSRRRRRRTRGSRDGCRHGHDTGG